MLRRDLLRALMATPLAGWLRPWLRPACGGAAEGPNAATVYRKAFDWAAHLPSDDSERLRKAANITTDDPRVVALIDQAGPAIEAIREAAALDRCRWGNEVVTTDELGKGHLDVSGLQVIRAACLSARRHAGSGRGRAALDDVFAGLSLAHRIGTGGFLFARVLECGGEVPAFQTLGRILPGLDREARDDLSRRLEVLPPPEPPSAAIGPESRFIFGSIRARLKAIGPVIRGEDWASLGFDEDEAAALQRLTGGNRAEFLDHLATTAPAFAELARRLPGGSRRVRPVRAGHATDRGGARQERLEPTPRG